MILGHGVDVAILLHKSHVRPWRQFYVFSSTVHISHCVLRQSPITVLRSSDTLTCAVPSTKTLDVFAVASTPVWNMLPASLRNAFGGQYMKFIRIQQEYSNNEQADRQMKIEFNTQLLHSLEAYE